MFRCLTGFLEVTLKMNIMNHFFPFVVAIRNEFCYFAAANSCVHFRFLLSLLRVFVSVCVFVYLCVGIMDRTICVSVFVFFCCILSVGVSFQFYTYVRTCFLFLFEFLHFCSLTITSFYIAFLLFFSSIVIMFIF